MSKSLTFERVTLDFACRNPYKSAAALSWTLHDHSIGSDSTAIMDRDFAKKFAPRSEIYVLSQLRDIIVSSPNIYAYVYARSGAHEWLWIYDYWAEVG